MAKTKAPFLSLSASGSVGRTLTANGPRSAQRLISHPTHAPTFTPAQMNQRFLYALGIALWNGMTTAERLPYQSALLGRSLSPMNRWLRVWLNTRPNLELGFPFAEGQGLATSDLSTLGFYATLKPNLWRPLGNSFALYLTGSAWPLNLTQATVPELSAVASTIAAAVRFDSLTGNHVLAGQGTDANNQWYLMYETGTTRWNLLYEVGGVLQQMRASFVPTIGAWLTIIVTHTAAENHVYINGTDLVGFNTWTTQQLAPTGNFRMGQRPIAGGQSFPGEAAWYAQFDTAISQAQAQAIHAALLPA